MGSQGLQGSFSVEEMEKSEVLWVRYEQRIAVLKNTSEKVKHSLVLIYDKHFLFRSKTGYSEFDKLDTGRKLLPLLLRSYSHFTNLVIRDANYNIFDIGVNSTLNFLYNKYWVIRGRQSIKSF